MKRLSSKMRWSEVIDANGFAAMTALWWGDTLLDRSCQIFVYMHAQRCEYTFSMNHSRRKWCRVQHCQSACSTFRNRAALCGFLQHFLPVFFYVRAPNFCDITFRIFATLVLQVSGKWTHIWRECCKIPQSETHNITFRSFAAQVLTKNFRVTPSMGKV